MQKRITISVRIAAILQLFTAALHSVSFFVKPQPTNETEKQFLDIMNTYSMDMGVGFSPTFGDLYLSMSISFALLFLFGGIINLSLINLKVDNRILKTILGAGVIIFGIIFIVTVLLTFIMPVVCTGLVFLTLLLSWYITPRSS